MLLLGATQEEEALAEYAARLLLLPYGPETPKIGMAVKGLDSEAEEPVAVPSLAGRCVATAGRARVTLHAVILRLTDPDYGVKGVQAAILWRLNPRVPADAPIEERLTPQWFASDGAFIPVGRCRARPGSLVAEVAGMGDERASGIRSEEVDIGSLKGRLTVDAFAWGSVRAGTRLVLFIARG